MAVVFPSSQAFLLAGIGWGDFYCKTGTVTLTTESGPRSLAVYKKNGKPFLLIGPYRVEDDNDFFFVAPDCAIRTATDKGSCWGIVGPLLAVNDDLSNYWNCLRAPCWYEARRKDGSISYDADRDVYVFQMRLNNNTEAATLTVPASHFTPDMPPIPDFLH